MALLVTLAGCGNDSFPLASRVTTNLPPTTISAPPVTTVSAAPTTTSPPAASTGTTTTVAPPPTSATAATPTTTPTTTPVVAATGLLARVGSAGQAIVVTASGYGVSSATLTAYDRTSSGWQVAYGPYTARVGYNGLAPPNEKREGDGRTPSGAYGFDFMFGVSANPGVTFPYRRVTQSIVWVDDPDSPLYNTWVDRDQQDPVDPDPEPMYQPLAYQYGAVIAYNASRAPGLGSAIFLHATVGAATAGCVSLPVNQLVEILKWLDPAASPRIVIGAG